MAELLVTIAIIGILASLASPIFIRLLRDRRSQHAAEESARMFEGARARAMGRGGAVVVRWNANAGTPTPADPSGHLTMLEGVDDTFVNVACVVPAEGCCGAWQAGNGSRYIASFDERSAQYDSTAITLLDAGGSQRDYAEVCFSPRGRTFVRFAPGGSGQGSGFQPLTGVLRMQVQNTRTGMVRQIVVPPNGNARVRGDL
ncbi:MAG: hypothetical protein HY908_04860 [Myxococcales bacterium]|nr:hypothetical protein [Myxococcales bacterium]